MRSVSGLGGSPGGRHCSPVSFPDSNPMNRGAWWATVHGVAKSKTRLQQLRTPALIRHVSENGFFLLKWQKIIMKNSHEENKLGSVADCWGEMAIFIPHPPFYLLLCNVALPLTNQRWTLLSLL